MQKIVQKFGGTSLSTHKRRLEAAQRIKEAREEGYLPIVVVSAIGREGKAYATDTLINFARGVNPELHPREQDLIMSCGEVISSVIMVQTLKEVNISGRALTGAQAGIKTDKKFGASSIISVAPARIFEIIEKNEIPVISGFQGISPDGEITTLGRGGSDTTASVVASAVQADFIEIYTDVEGVMTADPDIIEEAQLLEEADYRDICEMAYQGASVIHPRAAEIAMESEIPVKVKSFANSRQKNKKTGTLIHNLSESDINSDRPVTGLASRGNIVFVQLKGGTASAHFAENQKIFKLMAEAGISVDFINIREEAISFVIRDSLLERAHQVLRKHNFSYKVNENLAKISIIGGGMTGQPGIMSRVVAALNQGDISIYQTTDSHTTISCLIAEKEQEKALALLHKIFELGSIDSSAESADRNLSN